MKTEALSRLLISGLFAGLLVLAGCRTANDSDRPWSQPLRDESILNMGLGNQTIPRPGGQYP
jgi:hypothetical protein